MTSGGRRKVRRATSAEPCCALQRGQLPQRRSRHNVHMDVHGRVRIGGCASHTIQWQVVYGQVFAHRLWTPQLGRCVLVGIEDGIERIDALEGEERAVAEAAGLVHLPAFEQVEEDVERGGPGGDTHTGAGFRKGLGHGEPEAAVVCDPCHEGALAGKIDG